MAIRVCGTGDDARGPDPVAGSASHLSRDVSPRPLLGYVRASPVMDDGDVERLRRNITAYASLEGFVLLRVLVDRSRLHTAAFAELIRALTRGEAAHVVVPALHHLAHFPGVQLAMKDLLEVQTGARVLVMCPAVGELV